MGLVYRAGLRQSWQERLRSDARAAGDALHRVGVVAPIRLFRMRLARGASDARLAAVSGVAISARAVLHGVAASILVFTQTALRVHG